MGCGLFRLLRPLPEELTKHNFAVYAFDMRGHGNSGGPRYFIKSFDEYISDLDVFLKRVQPRAWIRPLLISVGYFQFQFPQIVAFLPANIESHGIFKQIGVPF